MALLPEIPHHDMHIFPQGFQLFQRLRQAITAVHIQHTSRVEVVRQIVEFNPNLMGLFDNVWHLRQFHDDLLPADRPSLFQHLSDILTGGQITHDRFILYLLPELVINSDSDAVGILASFILRCTH